MSQLKRYNGTSWEVVGGVNIPVNDTYSESTTVPYSSNYVNEQVTEINGDILDINEKLEDTGWVDLSAYVNTNNFAIRSGYTPMARKIGNAVYLRGGVYCHTSPAIDQAAILSNLPAQFRTSYNEINGTGLHYGTSTIYKIWLENGQIVVKEGSTIPATYDWQGYTLSDLGPYLVD